jgi:hypothetical protein
MFFRKSCNFCSLALFTILFAGGSAAMADGIGPDVIVGDLVGINRYPTTSPYNVGGIVAYAIGTTSCNIGDQLLEWFSNNNRHPVIAQNFYRLKDGRFEQIGMSWLKHGWCAVDGFICGTCQTGTNCNYLGLACSDPYSASLNADQADLGPRSEINPVTGEFPYPYSLNWNQTGNAIFKRLQVKVQDVDPAQNSGALYYAESHYVHPQDAQGGNDRNNNSWRRFNIGANYSASFTGSTVRMQPAIYAWKANDSAVNLVEVDIPGGGYVVVGARVTQVGENWRYEYAVQNVNAGRSIGSVSVPISPAITVSDVGFHDVPHHSGEPYANTPWNSSVTGSAVQWNSPQTFVQNKYTNALRWGSLYNYRFLASVPPTTSTMTLGMFVPGAPESVDVTTLVPSIPVCVCPGDLTGDGLIDGDDIQLFVAMLLGAQAVDNCADLALPNGGPLDSADVAAFVNMLSIGEVCPP